MSGTNQTQAAGRSGLGIAGFVLGIIAAATSFLPILNNGSAIIAVVGLVLAIVGTVSCMRGKKSGKGLAIAGVILNIAAFAIVLVTQSMYSAAIDDALSGPTVVSQGSEQQASQTAPASESSDSATQEPVAAGNSITLSNGLVLTVDNVVAGLTNYDGSPITQVTVTYQNNGSDQASFNLYDWKGQDAQGAQRTSAYYSEAENQLNSGSIAAGGSVSGNVYFDGDIVKVIYENAFIGRGSDVAWDIE